MKDGSYGSAYMAEVQDCLCGAKYPRRGIIVHNCSKKGQFPVPEKCLRSTYHIAAVLFHAGFEGVEFRNGEAQVWGVTPPLEEVISETMAALEAVRDLQRTADSSVYSGHYSRYASKKEEQTIFNLDEQFRSICEVAEENVKEILAGHVVAPAPFPISPEQVRTIIRAKEDEEDAELVR